MKAGNERNIIRANVTYTIMQDNAAQKVLYTVRNHMHVNPVFKLVSHAFFWGHLFIFGKGLLPFFVCLGFFCFIPGKTAAAMCLLDVKREI